jgi:methylglyoxal synthase
MRGNITLALIAHDRQKEALVSFILDHRAEFSRLHLVATAGTGSVVRKSTGLPVDLLDPGPAGGDREIADLAAESEVQAVIFLRDPEGADPGSPDFTALLRVCDARDIPVATNLGTAAALIYFLHSSPDRGLITARPWGLV